MARIIRCSVFFTAIVILSIPATLFAVWPSDPAVNVPLTSAFRDQLDPRICPDRTGGAIVTWEDYRETSAAYKIDVYAQRVAGLGLVQWAPDGAPVCTLDTWARFPVIAADGRGGAIVAWDDWRSGRDIYAQRLDARGNPQWTSDGIPVCTASGDQRFPTIIADAAGGVFVAWQDYRPPGYSSIYVQHLDADGAPLWGVDGTAATSTSGGQEAPQLVLDGSGGVIVVWHDQRISTIEKDIYAQRLNSAGFGLWAADGVPLTMAAAQQIRPEAVTDGAGGAIVVWEDHRAYPPDHIYARRVDSSGNVLWAADGVPICTASGVSEGTAICADGAGGAIIAWMDKRTPSPPSQSEIYAQRIDGDGNPLWPLNGELICTADYSRNIPSIISDGAGGAILAWTDNRRYPIHDLYAQRLNGAGVSQWTLNGELVSLGQSADPVMVLATTGCAVVAWTDGSYNVDVHAQDVPLGHVSDVTDRRDPSEGVWLSTDAVDPLDRRTVIRFGIPREARVALDLFDPAGHRLCSLLHATMAAGDHEVSWDGCDGSGRRVASGVYLARLIVDGIAKTGKLLTVR